MPMVSLSELSQSEKRAQLRADLLAAWNDYESTGLHVTGEEADAWLKRLIAGQDVEPPTPHP
ncbi:MAG: hypothetical protein AB7R90_15615 [Reyranellaceae bacterium]